MREDEPSENHARIIGTSKFGQPLAIYKDRTYELMPLGLDTRTQRAVLSAKSSEAAPELVDEEELD